MTDQQGQPQQIGRPAHWHPNRKRPSLYDEGVLDRFLDKLSSTAQSIKQICEPEDMPRSVDVFIACGRDPALRARIAQAREAQQDVIVDELLEIADTATPEEVNLAKLRIWTRQWAAARFAPKKYGEKQSVEVQHTLSETAARVLADLSARQKQQKREQAKIIDVTPSVTRYSLKEGGAAGRNASVINDPSIDCTDFARVEPASDPGEESPRAPMSLPGAAAAAPSLVSDTPSEKNTVTRSKNAERQARFRARQAALKKSTAP